MLPSFSAQSTTACVASLLLRRDLAAATAAATESACSTVAEGGIRLPEERPQRVVRSVTLNRSAPMPVSPVLLAAGEPAISPLQLGDLQNAPLQQ